MWTSMLIFVDSSTIEYARVTLNRYVVDYGFWGLMVLFLSLLFVTLYTLFRRNLSFNSEELEFINRGVEKVSKLDEAIRQYRELVEHANDIIFRTDLNGNFSYVNPVASKITGYSEEELLKMNYLDLIDPADRERVENFYIDHFKGEKENTYLEFRASTKNGRSIWLGQNVKRLMKDGSVIGFQAVTRDIAAQKNAESQLKSHDELLRLFVKHTPAAVAMFDSNMRYLAVSDRWLEDYHVEDCSIIGKSHYEVFPDLDEQWKEIYEKCLSGIVHKGMEEPFRRPDGTTEWVRGEVHPWKAADGDVGGLIVFSEFVTQRKEMENALKKAKEVAEETSRAKTNFIANISHEFKTPLTGILGFSDLLLQEKDLSREHKVFVDEIRENGKQLLYIVDRILELSRLDLGKMEFQESDITPADMLEQIATASEEKHNDNNNEVELVLDDSVRGAIRTDAGKLSEILENVIDNAMKFTKQGQVTIAASLQNQKDDSALLSVSISDTGPGIPGSQLKHVFKPFVKSQNHFNDGVGLGLTITKKLLTYLGGECELKSKEGKGTKVDLFVPVKMAGMPENAVP